MREDKDHSYMGCVKKGYTFIEDELIEEWTKVIRCKDCEYWDSSWNTQSPDEHFCTMMDTVVGSMEFCARAAERKKYEID